MDSKKAPIRSSQRLHEDEAKYYKAATALKLEELKARQEKNLIRQYRQRQRRIWLTKAKAVWLPAVMRLKQHISRKRVLSVAAILGAVVVTSSVLIALSRHAKSQTVVLAGHTPQQDFKPAVPPNSPQKVTTAENNHQTIATYQDAFAGSNLVVSQQKLPDSFKSDPQAITKLDQFKSAQSLDTPKGKLYITTNPTGQQWAAITYGDLLIFFQTSKTIDSDNWYKYINALQVH